jgi:hypothetical protein
MIVRQWQWQWMGGSVAVSGSVTCGSVTVWQWMGGSAAVWQCNSEWQCGSATVDGSVTVDVCGNGFYAIHSCVSVFTYIKYPSKCSQQPTQTDKHTATQPLPLP